MAVAACAGVLTVVVVDNRVSARAAPSVTARFFATTSRVLPSPPSAVSLAVVV